uniref:Uncharacterized protein n=1 Tax=Cynoglossus semilaevis TaxID=244447 RepID=A0A3P8X735_CYNSE
RRPDSGQTGCCSAPREPLLGGRNRMVKCQVSSGAAPPNTTARGHYLSFIKDASMLAMHLEWDPYSNRLFVFSGAAPRRVDI